MRAFESHAVSTLYPHTCSNCWTTACALSARHASTGLQTKSRIPNSACKAVANPSACNAFLNHATAARMLHVRARESNNPACSAIAAEAFQPFLHSNQSCPHAVGIHTPSECLKQSKAESASSKLGVQHVQPRAAHGSHASHGGCLQMPSSNCCTPNKAALTPLASTRRVSV